MPSRWWASLVDRPPAAPSCRPGGDSSASCARTTFRFQPGGSGETARRRRAESATTSFAACRPRPTWTPTTTSPPRSRGHRPRTPRSSTRAVPARTRSAASATTGRRPSSLKSCVAAPPAEAPTAATTWTSMDLSLRPTLWSRCQQRYWRGWKPG